jgi:hypothetical protein
VDYSDWPDSPRFISAEDDQFDDSDFILDPPAEVQSRAIYNDLHGKGASAPEVNSISTAKGAPTPAAISISNSKAKRVSTLEAGRGSTDYHYPSAPLDNPVDSSKP